MKHALPVCAVVAFSTLVIVAACAPQKRTPEPRTESTWQEFEGTWTAAGTRTSIQSGEGRSSSIASLKGSMLLSGSAGLGVGFLCETIVLTDSDSRLVGRSVWTDQSGDQVFSELTGAGNATANLVEGTVVGGSGRYAGAEGAYSFSWQYLTESAEGGIQGRAVGFRGRVRLGGQQVVRP